MVTKNILKIILFSPDRHVSLFFFFANYSFFIIPNSADIKIYNDNNDNNLESE